VTQKLTKSNKPKKPVKINELS